MRPAVPAANAARRAGGQCAPTWPVFVTPLGTARFGTNLEIGMAPSIRADHPRVHQNELAAGVLPAKLNHGEVIETAAQVHDKFQKFLNLVLGILC